MAALDLCLRSLSSKLHLDPKRITFHFVMRVILKLKLSVHCGLDNIATCAQGALRILRLIDNIFGRHF